MRTRWIAAGAGVAAAGLSLGVAELLAGLIDSVPSLVTSVGSVLIPFVPPALEDWAIQTFGTSDKLVLNLTTILVTLGIGAWAGVAGAVRRTTAAWLFAGFAGLGLAAALTQPLIAPAAVVLATLAVAGTGLAALLGLLSALDTPPGDAAGPAAEPGREPTSDRVPRLARRRVLGAIGAVAVSAAVAGWIGRSLIAGRDVFDDVSLEGLEPVRRLPPPGPRAGFDDIAGLTPIVVPNDDFYRIDTALTVPRLDPDTWRLRIHGMVDREVELGYSELLEMDLVEAYITMSCVSNEIGDDLVGNAEWLGVPLVDVLGLAGVREEATQVVGRAVDGWTGGFPVEAALDGRDALVAVGMNGEPLPLAHGFPVRLVVPGLYGYVSATKWLTEIELTTFEAFDAYWVPRGWAERGPIKTQSRIDVPRGGERIDAGETVVAGVAWAGHRGVQAVEIRVDDGPWQACELTEELSRDAWRQFRLPVSLASGEHTLTVRATDGTGQVQTAESSPPRPDGATGRHMVRVSVT